MHDEGGSEQPSAFFLRRADALALAALVLVQLAIVAIAQPRGDFPLNDDWAYARSVQWLLAEGRIRLSPWVGMDLVPQTLAGGAAAALFGFSFETLRHVTQAVALGAMMGAYGWFRVARLEPVASFTATAALAAFPAWPVLSNSYMTDLYGLALALPAAALFLAALRAPTAAKLWAATALSVAGTLERQVALVIPFAFLATSLWIQRPRTVRGMAIAAAPLVASLAAAMAYHGYLALGPGVPEGQRLAYGRLLPMASGLFTEPGVRALVRANAAGMAGYLGWFSAGWLAWHGMAGARRAQVGIVFAGGAAIASAALAAGWLPPYRTGQVIDAAGIGPLLLYDTVRGMASIDRGAGIFWRAIAVPAAFATAGLLVMACVAAIRALRLGRGADAASVFALVVVAAYLAPFALTDYFDRYLVFVLPFIFVVWARTWQPSLARPRQALAAVWIVAAVALSAAATRDYFSWNRARWDAIRLAEREGGSAATIDGGFEYNAWRLYEKGTGTSQPSWWWIHDDQYVVAFTPVPGYREIKAWELSPWLPRTPRKIRLLRRDP